MSSLAEIQEAIEKLASEDRARLREWFDSQDVEETDNLLAAIDEGIRSAETERTFSLEEVRAEIMFPGRFEGWLQHQLPDLPLIKGSETHITLERLGGSRMDIQGGQRAFLVEAINSHVGVAPELVVESATIT